ncbi:unnamed protein product [Candidula unifasciata]|uniref:DH domain-containing protein n=1 Tax=Candidula unifasciata TaxID=100452 RepID=A0A8S3Z3L7_9EUPU|nr:unnamed protein product [Candidula unifasciata]
MKFFTNYEEYLHPQTTPQASVTKANNNSSSTSPSPSSSKSSSIFPATVSTSSSKVNNIDDSSVHTPLQDKPSFTPARAAAEDRKDTSSKLSRSSERASRRSDRRGSNAKHEGLSSRSGFSRSSKKRDHAASSEAGNRSSQGIVSYVSRVVTEIVESERTYISSLEDIIHGYMEPMENLLTSNDAKADLKCLFSNIREIYKFGW